MQNFLSLLTRLAVAGAVALAALPLGGWKWG
jgi:hypothetical protein